MVIKGGFIFVMTYRTTLIFVNEIFVNENSGD